MRVLINRFWREPAFCIGVLGSVAMIALKVLSSSKNIHSIDQLAQILLPLVGGLVARGFVSPAYAGKPPVLEDQ